MKAALLVVVMSLLIGAANVGLRSQPAENAAVSPAPLAAELATLAHLKLVSQGFDYTVQATCLEGGTTHPLTSPFDLVRYTCRLLTVNPANPRRAPSFAETADCRVPGSAARPRCFSSGGDALQ